MQATKWVVVTGPPSSGKTSIVNVLAKMGYLIIPEVAREIICYTLGSPELEHRLPRNSLALQREILAITLKREHHLPCNQRIIFDRGSPDSIAYFKFHHFNPKVAYLASKFRRYDLVFYCQPVGYVKDLVRIENERIAQDIGQRIIHAYHELGYELKFLPPVSLQERVEMILDHLQDTVK